MAVVLVLAAAACGGDDDDAADSDGGGNDAEAPTDGGGADVGASVTVDGITYEATEELVCIARGGYVGGSFTNADGTIEINIDVSPEPEEPNGVRVDDSSDPADKVQWESGGDVVELHDEFRDVAQVTGSTVGDRGATGTATFIDTTKLADGTAAAVEGTFEIQCPDA